MEEAIKNFSKQFGFKPEIVNGEKLKPAKKFIVAGMGGSHLAADVLKTASPFTDVYVHHNYGLPPFPEKKLRETMLIASSYSGNTEEAIDFAKVAFENKHNLICIAVGEKLIEFAKKNGIPYIQIPDTGIQPRSALGFSLISMARAMADGDALSELATLETKLNPMEFKNDGKALAESLKGKIPVIYTSEQNSSIAYNWKIKFNETGKIPAFYNTFPELNHNEMTGYDVVEGNRALSSNLYFIFIASSDDHPRIQKRMEVCEKLYQNRGFSVTKLWLEGENRFERIFRSLLLADWTALHTAWNYGAEPDEVPLVEEFKRLIT